MAHVWAKRPTHWSCDEEVGIPHLQATHGILQKGFLYPLAIPNTVSFVTSPQVRPLTDQPHGLLPKDLKAPPQRAKMGAVASFTEGNVMKKILAILLLLTLVVGCGAEPSPLGDTMNTESDATEAVETTDSAMPEPSMLSPSDAIAYFKHKGAKVEGDSKIDLARELILPDLRHLKALPNLKELDLFYTSITDEDLVHLGELIGLESLNLRNTSISNDGVAHLADLTSLRRLNLSGTEINGQALSYVKDMTLLVELELSENNYFKATALVHLKRLTKLESLGLPSIHDLDNGLSHIKHLSELKVLGLGGERITRAGLEHLQQLTQLEKLYFLWSPLTEVGLGKMKNLRELYLQGSEMLTDTGLVGLNASSNLEVLDLQGTQITDAGLVHLKGMTKLQSLGLRGTQVTDAGVADLQKALPNCEISH